MKPSLTRDEFNALASMATEPGGLTAAQIERLLVSHRALFDALDPHEPAFYKVGQTGVEPAVPAETGLAERVKALEAEVQRFVGERDAALSKLGTLKNNLSITMRRTTVLEVLAGKVNAIRHSIVGMQGFNFSEHAYPLVAALDEAGFASVGYEMAAKNLGTLIEQRDAAEKRAESAEAERDRMKREEEQNEHIVEWLRTQVAALRTAIGNFLEHKRGHPERRGVDALWAVFNDSLGTASAFEMQKLEEGRAAALEEAAQHFEKMALNIFAGRECAAEMRGLAERRATTPSAPAKAPCAPCPTCGSDVGDMRTGRIIHHHGCKREQR